MIFDVFRAPLAPALLKRETIIRIMSYELSWGEILQDPHAHKDGESDSFS